MSSWYEDDQFWINYGPLMFNSFRWAVGYDEAAAVSEILELEPGSRIMDSCCGVGRHSIELSRLGYKVTGVDRTEPYIQAASETAGEEELDTEFVLADVREFSRKNYFDAVINMFTSFGYFENDEDQMKYLKQILNSLKPGGKLLIDTMGKETLARDFKECEWFEEDGNTILLEYRILDDWSRLENRWVIINEKERIDTRFTHRVYSAFEMKELLLGAGFSDVKIFGNMKKSVYNHTAERLIAVAVK